MAKKRGKRLAADLEDVAPVPEPDEPEHDVVAAGAAVMRLRSTTRRQWDWVEAVPELVLWLLFVALVSWLDPHVDLFGWW